MDKKEIAIVVPIYLASLSSSEKASLEQCLRILSDYSIVVIKPKSLNIDVILNHYGIINIESFPDDCFASLRAYNKLVLSEAFYRRFQSYSYMLIYQLDAYVFRDELLYWANKGYDYIGAPWLPWKKRHLSTAGRLRLYCQRSFCKLFKKEAFKSDKYYAYKVGNGGFSLRKISKMLEITVHYENKIRELLSDDASFYPEDVFLLHELTNRRFRLMKPDFKEALRFAIEEKPEWAYLYNGKQLPFGCHAWSHKDYLPFWELYINAEVNGEELSI